MCYDTFEIQPRLAVEWNMVDSQTVEMTLREGVVFSNGDPLTAYDVQFSIDRAAENPHAEPIVGMISHVTVQGTYDFTIHLEVPFAPILRHLAQPIAGILPRDYYARVGADAFADAPVGTGPFMLEDWVIGDRISLVRNPNYWGPAPVLERLVWREVPDASTRLIEVETGGVDLGLGISAADLAVAQASPDVTLVRRQNLSIDYLGFNCQAPYISDYRVRQAIAYALDTTAIFNTVWRDFGSVATGPLNDIVWGAAPTQPFPQNLDRARELLAEAGYPDGFDATIWYNTGNPQRQDQAEMIAHTLREIGINLEVQGIEWSAYLEGTARGDHDMFILGWVSITADADYGLYGLFHSSMHGPSNRTFFSDPEVDRLLDLGREETDPAARLQIYYDVQQLLRDAAPWIWLRQGEEAVAISNDLRGFVINPAGHHNYTRLWFD